MNRKQKKLLVHIVIAAALMIFALLFPDAKIILSFACYIAVGYDVVLGAARNILHGQIFDERFLMTVATLGALALSEFTEASAVMLFYQTGELLQSLAVSKSRRSIASLMDIRPDRAVVLRGGSEIEVSPEEVEVGETIIVRPGERIALDGEVISGFTGVDTAALTGESIPSDKSAGDSVMSGTVNLSGVIQIKTTSRAEDSCVSRILE
ncbi:MAG: heavy metal translocating P-type ATPase, partial [Oscillospiraceae bacterium]|nr:heavy metal translocating P-type ATPase [Oscillospiraceae bacterium]